MARADIAPTNAALKSSGLRAQIALLEYNEVLAMCENGVFRKPAPPTADGSGRQSPGPRKRKAPVERAPTAAEQELAGEEFEDGGARWRCLMPGWDVEHAQVVIFYYNMEEVEASGVAVEEMEEAIDNDEDHDSVERSSVAEVRRWAAATRRINEAARETTARNAQRTARNSKRKRGDK